MSRDTFKSDTKSIFRTHYDIFVKTNNEMSKVFYVVVCAPRLACSKHPIRSIARACIAEAAFMDPNDEV